MTRQVKARSGHVFTVADDEVEGWVDRGYTEVAPPPEKKTTAKKSAAAKKSDSK